MSNEQTAVSAPQIEETIEVLEVPGLKIKARVIDGALQLEPHGPLKILGQAITKPINEYFGGERPLLIRDGQIMISGWIPAMPSPAFSRLIRSEAIIHSTGRLLPEQISIAVTGRCPCDCYFCCAKGIRATPELTTEEIKSILDQGVKMGTHLFTFDGGEPLLRDDIYEIIAHAAGHQRLTVMFTNGLYLTREAAQRLKEAGLHTLQVSIDSPYEKDHNAIRKVPGIFKKAVDGISFAREAGLITGLYYVARPENTDEQTLEDLYQLAHNQGAHEVSIYDIIAIGRWLTHEAETMTPADRERTIRFHKAKNAPGQQGPKVMSFSYLEGPERFGCMAGRKWMHFTPAGDGVPCSYMPLSFGNIRQDSLKQIYKRMRALPEIKACTKHCLVQHTPFREKYIYTIAPESTLPHMIQCHETADTPVEA